NSYEPGLRIEFLTIDVNGNGTIEWDEGFMRVWEAKNAADSVRDYVTARRWPNVPSGSSSSTDPNMVSRNCGARLQYTDGTFTWLTARQIYDTASSTSGGSASRGRDAVRWALTRGKTGSS